MKAWKRALLRILRAENLIKGGLEVLKYKYHQDAEQQDENEMPGRRLEPLFIESIAQNNA